MSGDKVHVTVRMAIKHMIPGVSLDTHVQQVLAVEACRALIDSGNFVGDWIADAFEDWYRDTWTCMQMYDATGNQPTIRK